MSIHGAYRWGNSLIKSKHKAIRESEQNDSRNGSRAERREGSVRRADLQVRQTCGKPPAQTCTFRAKFGPGNRENHTRTPERHRRRMLSTGPVRSEPLVGEFLVHRYIRFRFCVSVAVAVWAPPIVLKPGETLYGGKMKGRISSNPEGGGVLLACGQSASSKTPTNYSSSRRPHTPNARWC